MTFNSFEYLAFFVFVLIAYWCLSPWRHLRIILLLIASWYFYAASNGWVILVLILSTLIDYWIGIYLENYKDNSRRKKIALFISIFANIGVLGFFKYFNFFIDTEYWTLGLGEPTFLDIFLPVGISFYTFQSLSYSIDVYRGVLKAERSFLNFAFYISFFPQLVAGPIVRAKHFLHQIPSRPRLSIGGFESAVFLIATGLFKKIVLGDTLGDYANTAFSSPAEANTIEMLLAIYAFTFQIYFDFSGYSDIAIGCSRLLGFRLPPNFRRPYVATSFSEFWRRWHISLSFWLRDYLYKSIGGSRSGSLLTYRNLFIVMLLGGLWHGAAWTFVLWGGAHGLILAVERITRQAKLTRSLIGKPVERFLRSFIVFNVCAVLWVPFRATDFSDLVDIFYAVFRWGPGINITYGMILAISIICFGYASQWVAEFVSVRRVVVRSPVVIKALIYGVIGVAAMIFSSRGVQPFIYFQF